MPNKGPTPVKNRKESAPWTLPIYISGDCQMGKPTNNYDNLDIVLDSCDESGKMIPKVMGLPKKFFVIFILLVLQYLFYK